MLGNLNRSDSKSSGLAGEADRQSTGTQRFRRYESLEDIMQPVTPARTYQASAADRHSRMTILSLTAYSTLQHTLQVRNDGSEYAMMAPMIKDARIEVLF